MILVVEDSEIVLTAYQLFLRKLGLSFKIARSGEEALATLKIDFFDLIFCDLNLPDINGFDLAKKIATQNKQGNIRIVAVSVDIDEVTFNTFENYFDCYIKKPFDIEVLRNLIEFYKGKNHNQNEG